MNTYGKGFEYLIEKFPKLSDAKLKDGIFIGPQIREMINYDPLEHLLTESEKSALLKFKAVCLNFLGAIKAENNNELVKELCNAYQTMESNMSLKIRFLLSHLDFLPPILGAVSDKHGEMFHQDILNMEKRYAGKSSQNMLAD
jgi:hypothetical protein